MTNLDQAIATQLANIEKRTGKTLAELTTIVHASGLTKHSELVRMLKSTLGMGHGDANMLVHTVRGAAAASASPAPTASTGTTPDDQASVLAGLYTGPKASLRPIHEAVLAAMQTMGPFETAPKKSYVSYRRRKQFCMVGPATNTRVDVGLNLKGLEATERLEALPAGQMCQYKVRLTDPAQVDRELMEWIRLAYDAAE